MFLFISSKILDFEVAVSNMVYINSISSSHNGFPFLDPLLDPLLDPPLDPLFGSPFRIPFSDPLFGSPFCIPFFIFFHLKVSLQSSYIESIFDLNEEELEVGTYLVQKRSKMEYKRGSKRGSKKGFMV